MQNYYEILGLSNQANLSEIKIAFRKLAKLYHPDKNPNGIEHFAKVLKAYEVLSDPNLKASYDYKITYHHYQSHTYTKTTAKKHNFTEQELKRRKYYDEHIKKYAKKYAEQTSQQPVKSNYNEYKYILFATPVAVLLFLLLVTMATPNNRLEGTMKNKEINLTDSTKTQHDKKN
ncbi:MAG: DnaJ domain-containing protein [Bacteroidota bacterium]|nr:DnaJ domain-containing protein [Bacteroidota bacterium]